MSSNLTDDGAGAPIFITGPTVQEHGQHRLSGRLGTGAIIFMVVAGASPLTNVAGVVPIGIALGNGSSYPAAFLVATVVLLLFAVGFTAMTKYVEDAGAFYSYVAKGLGRRMGVGTAFLALITYFTIYLAVIAYIGQATSTLLEGHANVHIPWLVCSLALLAAVGFLGHRNVDLSGRVLAVLLTLEVAIIALIDVLVFAKGGGPEGISSETFSVHGFFEGAPGVALLFAVSGFIGFEATAIFRDEAVRPERTIPRATFGALLLIGGFYFFGAWAVVSWWGDSRAQARAHADPSTMVSDTANALIGSAGGDIIQALLVTSLFAALLTFHNVLSRYLHALGRQRDLPVGLARTHPNHISPHVASMVTTLIGVVSIFICASFGLDPVLQVFTWFAGVGTIGIQLLMLLTSAAVVWFFATRRTETSIWRGLVAPSVGTLGLIGCLVLGLDNITLLVGGSGLLAWSLIAVLVVAFVTGMVAAWTRDSRALVRAQRGAL